MDRRDLAQMRLEKETRTRRQAKVRETRNNRPNSLTQAEWEHGWNVIGLGWGAALVLIFVAWLIWGQPL